MRILAIGDFHGKFPKKLQNIAKKADLVLSTGDFGGSKDLLKVVFKYFYEDWTKKVGKKKTEEYILKDYNSGKKIINQLDRLKVPIYSSLGNWDFKGTKTEKQRSGGLKLKSYSNIIKKTNNLHLLNRRIAKIRGLKVYGFGGQVTASIYLTKEGGMKQVRIKRYKIRHANEKKQLFKRGRKNIDILLAHYPAQGYFDVVRWKGENPMNGKHIGFKPYTEFIKKYQPKLFVCGHMHEYQGIKKLRKTTIISTGDAQRGKAALIEIEGGKINNIKFLR